ncbi:MAG: 4Fe-4S binding protein [Bacteroidales bacterium]|nr:4Fe-4S binding protein [Bacteroidales bacterium]
MTGLHTNINKYNVPVIRSVSISINSSKCNACGACAKACPSNVLAIKTTPLGEQKISIEKRTACLGCLRCMTACRNNAIEITRHL